MKKTTTKTAKQPTNENEAKKAAPTPEILGKKTGKDSEPARWSWEILDRPFYRYALLVATSVIISFLLAPGLSSSRKEYNDKLIGQISPTDIRSPGDYNVKDLDATERKRAEAERRIYPIYNYQSKLGNEIQIRIDNAFRQMQSVVHDFIIAHLIIPDEEAENRRRGVRAKKEDVQISAEDFAAQEDEIRNRRLQKVVDDFETYFTRVSKDGKLSRKLKGLIIALRGDFNRTIQAVIPEKDYIQLYQFHFSPELMLSLQRMVGDVLSRKIINDKELMERGHDAKITIRTVDEISGKPAETTMRDVNDILDYKEVNRSLWRYTNILSNLGSRQRELLLRIGGHLVSPNLSMNRSLTIERRRLARESVKTMLIPVKKGEMIIRDGERFEKRHLTILRGIERELSQTNPFEVMIGYTFFFLVFLATLAYFGMANIRKLKLTLKDLTMMALLLVLFILMVKAVGIIANALGATLPSVNPSVYFLAIPAAVGAALVRIVKNSETATFFAIVVAIVFALLSTSPFFIASLTLATSFMAADAVGQVRRRTTLFFAGLRVSLVAMVLVLFMNLFSGGGLSMETVHELIAAAGSGIATGVILSGLTPIIEFIFSYTTDIKLLELANLNHPLLKKLIVQSPGTYHHSIMVGSLVEAAAESIHANPLLARVSAYYHDIGKIKTPQYFAENQPEGQNPHNSLSPSMSVLILLSHVREGVELARRYNLGKKITSIIEQHHGTNLIRFFYHQALEQEKEDEKGAVDENDFRYPGPKPQTREAGLVMLADSVEAATRSLQEPTPERIQGLVQKIINMIFRDGQLNECELTLKDLHQIARSFTKILVGVYHNRPIYPDESNSQEKPRNGRSNNQSAKKDPDSVEDVDDEDDKDIKRLGMP